MDGVERRGTQITMKSQKRLLTYRLGLQVPSQTPPLQASSLPSIGPPGCPDGTVTLHISLRFDLIYPLLSENEMKLDKTYLLVTPLYASNPESQLLLLRTDNITLHRRHHPVIV